MSRLVLFSVFSLFISRRTQVLEIHGGSRCSTFVLIEVLPIKARNQTFCVGIALAQFFPFLHASIIDTYRNMNNSTTRL